MSQYINDLLGFHFSSNEYERLGKRSLISDVVTRNIARIELAKTSLENAYDQNISEICMPSITTLLNHYKSKQSPSSVNLTNKQARILSYHISPTLDIGFLKYCISVLESNWSSVMTLGLLHSFMLNWTDFSLDNRTLIRYTIEKHIDSDNSRISHLYKPIKEYLDDPYLLGRVLYKNNKEIMDCCNVFSIPQSRINYSFFTPVFISYFEQTDYVDLNYLKKALKLHNSVQANKTIIPKFIIKQSIDKNLNVGIPKAWVNFAIEQIGDPTIESIWSPFPTATREVQTNLIKSREILIREISNDILNLFFEKLCYDKDRQNFWIQHISKISDFKIYGTYYSRDILSSYMNPEIISRHFHLITGNITNSALVMYMKKYVLIEFTESGALYVYQVDSSRYQNVFGNGKINRLDDFKIRDMHNLVLQDGYYYEMNDEGRMVHNGYWETRLNNWIIRKL